MASTLLTYFRANFENSGIFFNSVGFAVTISFPIYGMFNKPDVVKPAVETALYSFPFILFFLFITHHLILRMKIFNLNVHLSLLLFFLGKRRFEQ